MKPLLPNPLQLETEHVFLTPDPVAGAQGTFLDKKFQSLPILLLCELIATSLSGEFVKMSSVSTTTGSTSSSGNTGNSTSAENKRG
jgi:hypothetical protein